MGCMNVPLLLCQCTRKCCGRGTLAGTGGRVEGPLKGSLHHNIRTMARWLAIMVWAAVAASAVFWGLKLFVRAAPSPAHASIAVPASAQRGDLARLFGVDPTLKPPNAAPADAERSRFQLIGVIAPGNANSGIPGVALIAIDGKPGRAYKVGATLDSDRVLQAVQKHGVSIGPRGGAALILLELPALQSAAIGKLPAAGSSNGPAATQPKSSSQLASLRPPMPGSSRPHGGAPNALLNNPADMAQPDTSGSEGPATR